MPDYQDFEALLQRQGSAPAATIYDERLRAYADRMAALTKSGPWESYRATLEQFRDEEERLAEGIAMSMIRQGFVGQVAQEQGLDAVRALARADAFSRAIAYVDAVLAQDSLDNLAPPGAPSP